MEKAKVLIVIDTQNDFATGSLGTKEARATIPDIVRKITECGNDGWYIFDTMDTHGTDYLETNEGKHLPVVHTVKGTEGWMTVPAVRAVLDMYNAVDILKDTFGSADLANVIRAVVSGKTGKVITRGKDLAITLIGWCTDICVVTNALLLKTALPDAEIAVDAKCCAGVTPELHEAALAVMKSCQVTIE